MRPATTAACLDGAADWLDTADNAFQLLSQMASQPIERGGSVQGDLRLLAEWLRQHPDVDAAMFACLDAVEVP